MYLSTLSTVVGLLTLAADPSKSGLMAAGHATKFEPSANNQGHVRIPVSGAPKTGTVSLWFKVEGNNDLTYDPLFRYTVANLSSEDRWIYMKFGLVHVSVAREVNATGVITYDVISSPAGRSYKDGQWHHLAHTLGDSGSRLYIDGEEVAHSAVKTTAFPHDIAEINLGRSRGSGGAFYLRGQLDDVRVDRDVLDLAQIRAAMFHEISGTDASLYGYWRLGDVILNEAGPAYQGTIHGDAVAVVSGAPINNKALKFDGVDDRVSMGDRPALAAITGPFAVEAWIYPTGNSDGTIVSSEGRFAIRRRADGTLVWALGTPGLAFTDQVTTKVAPLNKWTHVALSYDPTGKIAHFFAHSLVVHSKTTEGPIGDTLPALDDFRVGAREQCGSPGCTGSQFFAGRIDEVRVWNAAVYQYSIGGQMYRHISQPYANLKGYWTLNEATGAVAFDSTMHGGNGALVGGPVHDASVMTPLIDVPYVYNAARAYVFRKTPVSWVAAQSWCAGLGYSLVTVDLIDEGPWLEKMQVPLSQEAFWYGLNDRTSEGTWAWASGRTSELRRWAAGQPDNNGDEDCVAGKLGGWRDEKCNLSKPFVCESP